ncbi:syndecan-3-like [Rana temporaria]|uniref:syndecan-3-like n=1 Tax=Rana temporaria TaxID=8407 RepID=UPI001AAD5081|nr:syndecan-3-like [Rana temporaria]
MHLAFGIIHGAGLLLLITQAALGQRWRKEFEDEKPFDLESSGDDDFIDEEEIDDVYSGSGSGDFELESRLDFGVRYTTETPILPPTATALKPAPTVQVIPAVQTTWLPPTTQATIVHRHHPWAPPEEPETPSMTAAPTPTNPFKEAPTAADITPGIVRTTEIHKLPPIIVVSTSTTPVPSSTEEETEMWEDTTENVVVIPSEEDSRLWPTEDERTVQTTAANEREIEDLDKVTFTQQPQTDIWEVTIATARDNEVEIPVSGGPSGDFEIQEEDSKSQTQPPTIFDLGNEVLPPGTTPTDHGRGRKADTGLIDNTIDSGNTLAQMPQKNILERREVLIAVIVGGVVGALFAAFLVMLLIYRMKKKDEGSYALEEPKPASVSYQKPDNHEEFYA